MALPCVEHPNDASGHLQCSRQKCSFTDIFTRLASGRGFWQENSDVILARDETTYIRATSTHHWILEEASSTTSVYLVVFPAFYVL